MTRDPLLPVRLVDDVWTTEGAGSAAVPTDGAPLSTGARDFGCDPYPPPWVKVVSLDANQSTAATERQPGIMAPMTWPASAKPDLMIPWMPWNYDKTEPRQWAKPGAEEGTVEIAGQTFRAVMTWAPPRRIFAAVALDGSGVWAIGDTEQEARAGALERRDYLRDEARVLDLDFPDASTDAAWLDNLALVTLSGTTESLRALIKSMETGDPVAPWCPADLWDNTTPPEEP